MTAHIDTAIATIVLQKGLGMIPDPVEPYYSFEALGLILGREAKTVENKLPKRLIERHPMGCYFRLSEVIKVLSDG